MCLVVKTSSLVPVASFPLGVSTITPLYRYNPFIHMQFHLSSCLFFVVHFSLCSKLPIFHLWQLYPVQWPPLWLVMAPTSMEICSFGSVDVVLSPPMIKGSTIRGVIHCATAATSVSDAFSGLCQLCHASFSDEFLFQSWASHLFTYVGVFNIRFQYCCQVHQWELSHWGLHHTTLGAWPW